jgi:hypothetical protein
MELRSVTRAHVITWRKDLKKAEPAANKSVIVVSKLSIHTAYKEPSSKDRDDYPNARFTLYCASLIIL